MLGRGRVRSSHSAEVCCLSLAGCEELNSCLDCLAAEYSSVKFCRIDAVATGASERFSSEVSVHRHLKEGLTLTAEANLAL